MVAFRGTLDVDAVFGGLSNIASGTTTSGSPPPPPPPPPATYLEFTSGPPSPLQVNASFSVEVTARDAQGGTATSFSGPIDLTLEGPIVAGGLTGNTHVNAVNGVATFSNLHISGACTGCVLKAAASGLSGATSDSFTVIGL